VDLPDRIDHPGAESFSSAKMLGLCLRNEIATNPNFYFFSPDETTSNKLDAVFEATGRAWNLPTEPWDKHMQPEGRVLELLSENALFAALTGHILTGGQGAITSYEAFFPIISSQIDQHLKFLAQSKEIPWRPKYSATNLLSTSTCWRQDHNGFTHQNPTLISSLLAKPSNLVNCLFPIDDIATVAAWEFMTKTQNVVNLTTFNKTEEPRWIDIGHARFQYENGGASIFGFASDENPDIILTAAGDIVSKETLHAIKIVKSELSNLKLRFIGITALSYQAIGTTENKLPQTTFNEYFTTTKPIIANFHGYPETLRSILTHYTTPDRLEIHGYQEQGSTTTPLDMLIRNRASRYDLAIAIFNQASHPELAEKYQQIIEENTTHIKLHGTDQPHLPL
jgi:xylulose-5-phosphate/fructose-6-phosphate phosphoketolase